MQRNREGLHKNFTVYTFFFGVRSQNRGYIICQWMLYINTDVETYDYT